MIETKKCYSEFNQKSKVICDYFKSNKENLLWGSINNFDAREIPINIIMQEPLLYEINKLFKIRRGGIMKLNKNKFYNWHKDKNRGVSLNMLLGGNGCHTLFGVQDEKYWIQYDIIELKYKPKTFYLFNTQVDHCVINFGKETRYMFTIEFEEDKTKLRYEEIYEWKEKHSV